MNDDYPTANDLDAMGATLRRDVCLWSRRLEREYATDRATERGPVKHKRGPHGPFKKRLGGRRIA